ncbi:metallophosphoesterase family protein [Catenovulum agarivorans]|uniref:metallophosphoesterase family protein n=1 Tax=Catenovulum agarivorans TaxID=1172192 RepID=UPI00030E4C6B|nr:metallophosphoesterase [Catenovulum agarivorans]
MPTTLLQITDCHLKVDKGTLFHDINPYQRLAKCLDYAYQKQANSANNVGAILLTGDLVQDEVASSYQQLVELVNQYQWQVPICLVPGNHDVPELFTEAKQAIGAHNQPLLKIANWQIVLFDSYAADGKGAGKVDEVQVDNIYQLLKTHQADYLLAVLHHHLTPYGGFIDKYPLQDSQYFYNWLDEQAKSKQNKLKAIVHGHVHSTDCKYLAITPVFAGIASCLQFVHATEALNTKEFGLSQIQLFEDGRVTSTAIYLND